MGTYPGQYYPGFFSTAMRGLGRYVASLVLQPILKSVCLLSDAQVGKTPPAYLGVWVLDPLTPTKVLFVCG